MSSVRAKVYLLKAAADSDQGQSFREEGKRNEQQMDGVTGDDSFITWLLSVNIGSALVPVLVFEYCNLEELWRHLKQPQLYAGMIFTSRRCVQSVTEAIRAYDVDRQWESMLQNEWGSKPTFCVGPSTISKANHVLCPMSPECVITGRESHAQSLADKIIEVNANQAISMPLLYPCGASRRDVLQRKLADAKIKCSHSVVYITVKNPLLDQRLQDVTNEIKTSQTETVLCFFSPSGVKYVVDLLDPAFMSLEDIHVVAIGPTTRTALDDTFSTLGIRKRVMVCKDPTPEALVDLIQSEIIGKREIVN